MENKYFFFPKTPDNYGKNIYLVAEYVSEYIHTYIKSYWNHK